MSQALRTIELAQVHIDGPHDTTGRVQEVHSTLLHVISEIAERSY